MAAPSGILRARVLPPPDVRSPRGSKHSSPSRADPHTFVPSLFSDGSGVER
jgi:hypothetical protein